MNIPEFRKRVWAYYEREGRHDLPWRKRPTLYRVLVSEMMLQQTQVARVIPLYKNFIRRFPTAKTLADASLAEVLTFWQGLGYNRRAKMLREAVGQFVATRGRVSRPRVATLEKLPGIGPYTARAIAAFVYNEDVIVVETNIRTAVIQHFFAGTKVVSDRDIEKILKDALPSGNAREWYSALMDYGAYLKRARISHNARTEKYVKQATFRGSLREVRGAILRTLSRKGAHTTQSILKELDSVVGPHRHDQVMQALHDLRAEGLIQKARARYALPY